MSLSTPNLKPKSTYVHGVGADTTVTLETQPCVSPRTQKFKAWSLEMEASMVPADHSLLGDLGKGHLLCLCTGRRVCLQGRATL